MTEANEMFRYVPWPFHDGHFPQQLGAVVMRTVLEGAPALQVLHDPDGGWAVSDGVNDPNEPGACVATHIWHVIRNDPSLETLGRMPPGTQADRESLTAPWQFNAFTWEG